MKVQYHIPDNHTDPFSLVYEGNYFIYADGYSNLSNSMGDFSIGNLEKHIPMGYKTIIVCYRLIVLDNGEIVKSASEEELIDIQSDHQVKYFLSSDKILKQVMKDRNREVDSMVVYKPGSVNWSLSSCEWKSFEECKSHATELSESAGCRLIISRICDSIYWH